MDWFKFIKDNFDAGNYTVIQVKIFVVKLKITTDEFLTITGEVYTA